MFCNCASFIQFIHNSNTFNVSPLFIQRLFSASKLESWKNFLIKQLCFSHKATIHRTIFLLITADDKIFPLLSYLCLAMIPTAVYFVLWGLQTMSTRRRIAVAEWRWLLFLLPLWIAVLIIQSWLSTSTGSLTRSQRELSGQPWHQAHDTANEATWPWSIRKCRLRW